MRHSLSFLHISVKKKWIVLCTRTKLFSTQLHFLKRTADIWPIMLRRISPHGRFVRVTHVPATIKHCKQGEGERARLGISKLNTCRPWEDQEYWSHAKKAKTRLILAALEAHAIYMALEVWGNCGKYFALNV